MAKTKENKKDKVEKCFKCIKEFCEENNFSNEVVKSLNKFLGNYLQNRRCPTTIEMGLKLKALLECCNGDETTTIKIIERSIERGWASFYPISNYSKNIDNIPKRNYDIKERNFDLSNEVF